MEYLRSEKTLLQITGMTTVSLATYFSGYKPCLLNDFLFYILPQYLCVAFPEKLFEIYIFLFCLINFNGYKKPENSNRKRIPMIDHERATVSIIVSIAIYAADFNTWKPEFEKTESYGLSLMDVGVGSFIFNAGMVSQGGSLKKYLSSSIILIFLGIIRLVTVKFVGIEVNPTEYGIHSNFYFVLAFLNTIYCLIRSKYDFIVGLFIAAIHEYILKFTDFSAYILSENRNTFIAANKETITSVIAHLAIFLLSSQISKILFSKESRKIKSFKIYVLCIFFILSYYISKCYSPVSRRLGNSTYIFWILMLHMIHASLYQLMGNYFRFYESPTISFISQNMMFVFLYSNLIVLFGHIAFSLRTHSTLISHAHLIFYLLILFTIPAYICKKLKIKRINIGL